MKVQTNFLLLIAICLLVTRCVHAQSETKELIKAIESLVKSKSLCLSGRVSEPKQESAAGVAGVIVINAGAEADGKPFGGKFEIVSNPGKDEFAIVSKQPLPGLAIYDNGEDTVNSVVYRDDAFSISNLTGDLRQLLDAKNLAKYVARAKDVKQKSGKSGETIFECTLSPRMIRTEAPAGGGIGMPNMTARVKSIKGTFSLNAGKVTSMKFAVERSNPLAQMMEQGGGSIEVRGSGDLPDGVEMEEIMGDHMKDPVLIYELAPIKKPSKRTLQQMEKLQDLANAI